MSVQRITTIVFFLVVVIVALIGVYYIFSSPVIGEKDAELKKADDMIQNGTNMVIWLSVVLSVILVFAAMILTPSLNIIQNPASLKGTGLGIGVILVIFLIGYAMASGEVTEMYQKMGIDDESKSKLVGGLLNSVYILFIVGVFAYVFSSVRSLLKQL